MTIQETDRRRRGERAGISKHRIVEAARSMEPSALTMQALAERLGVRRSALNYHIVDRDELLHLVAVDVFENGLGPAVAPGLDWRDAIRGYAVRIRDAVLATGELVDYFKYRPAAVGSALGALDDFLQVLVRAGFDAETAGRVMQMIADYAMAFARDMIMSAGADHPQHHELHERLADADSGTYVRVREFLDLDLDLYSDRQFEFAIETVIRGLEGRVA